jgi:hypothetical protein
MLIYRQSCLSFPTLQASPCPGTAVGIKNSCVNDSLVGPRFFRKAVGNPPCQAQGYLPRPPSYTELSTTTSGLPSAHPSFPQGLGQLRAPLVVPSPAGSRHWSIPLHLNLLDTKVATRTGRKQGCAWAEKTHLRHSPGSKQFQPTAQARCASPVRGWPLPGTAPPGQITMREVGSTPCGRLGGAQQAFAQEVGLLSSSNLCMVDLPLHGEKSWG